MKIWFRTHCYQPCSWTYVWDGLRKAFKAIGEDVYDLYDLSGSPPENYEECIEMWWGAPDRWQWSGLPVELRVSIALSEAQSFVTLGRETAIDNLQYSDLIISPSQWATRAIMQSPIDTPVKVVFFGADTDEFPYYERNWDKPITFLHGGMAQFRKGSWLVPEAFVKAFGNTGMAKLIIASPQATPMFTQLKLEYGKHPDIEFIDALEESAMFLYKKAHIYISPHLAEGFGLMPLEAMATGMACLVSRISAPREFFSKDYGWWIEMSEDYAPVSQCLPDTSGFWRLPSIDSMAESMQKAAGDPKEVESRGMAASEYVQNNLTWEDCAKGIVNTVKEFIDENNLGSNARI